MGYEFHDVLKPSKEATDAVAFFFESSGYTVKNAESDPNFQDIDVDMIIFGADKEPKFVEVKADRHVRTGNYYFETVSNLDKGTDGCFIYSAADILAYYFVSKEELHLMDMQKVRTWFLENIADFETRKTSTVDVSGFVMYQSEGRLVPRWRVMEEVGVEVVDIYKLRKKML